MITLITAVPGSGKTLFSISMIEDALKENRPVYTNINGLVKEKFSNNHLLHDAPDDWRDCPNGSFVIYDEAQQPHLYPSNAQRGKVEDERLTALETHRHGGYDLVFITQAPTFVHHHIRKLVGRHIHLYRAKGISGAVKYEWSHTCELPNDRGEQKRADSTPWKFPKQYFPYYTSAVMHTHKFKLPLKFVVFFGIVLLAVLYLVSNAYSNGGLAILNSVEVGGGKGGQGLPAPAAAQLIPVSSDSSDWRLKGFVTIGSTSSYGRPLAVIQGSRGVRYIDFSQCSYDDFRIFVSCDLNGQIVTFNSGFFNSETKSNSPFSK